MSKQSECLEEVRQQVSMASVTAATWLECQRLQNNLHAMAMNSAPAMDEFTSAVQSLVKNPVEEARLADRESVVIEPVRTSQDDSRTRSRHMSSFHTSDFGSWPNWPTLHPPQPNGVHEAGISGEEITTMALTHRGDVAKPPCNRPTKNIYSPVMRPPLHCSWPPPPPPSPSPPPPWIPTPDVAKDPVGPVVVDYDDGQSARLEERRPGRPSRPKIAAVHGEDDPLCLSLIRPPTTVPPSPPGSRRPSTR